MKAFALFRALDRYLLLRHPYLWATRFHWATLGFVAGGLALAIGLGSTVSPDEAHFGFELSWRMAVGLAAAVGGTGGWLYALSRHKHFSHALPDRRAFVLALLAVSALPGLMLSGLYLNLCGYGPLSAERDVSLLKQADLRLYRQFDPKNYVRKNLSDYRRGAQRFHDCVFYPATAVNVYVITELMPKAITDVNFHVGRRTIAIERETVERFERVMSAQSSGEDFAQSFWSDGGSVFANRYSGLFGAAFPVLWAVYFPLVFLAAASLSFLDAKRLTWLWRGFRRWLYSDEVDAFYDFLLLKPAFLVAAIFSLGAVAMTLPPAWVALVYIGSFVSLMRYAALYCLPLAEKSLHSPRG